MSKRITVTVDLTLEVPDDTDSDAVTMDFDRCTGKEVGFDDYQHPQSEGAVPKTAKLLSWETIMVEDAS